MDAARSLLRRGVRSWGKVKDRDPVKPSRARKPPPVCLVLVIDAAARLGLSTDQFRDEYLDTVFTRFKRVRGWDCCFEDELDEFTAHTDEAKAIAAVQNHRRRMGRLPERR